MNEEQITMPARFTWHVWVLVALLAAMFVRTAEKYHVENMEAEIYDLRICQSEFDRHTPAQFQEMKRHVALMKALNEAPLLDWLLPDAWSTMQVLPKKIWVEQMKAQNQKPEQPQ